MFMYSHYNQSVLTEIRMLRFLKRLQNRNDSKKWIHIRNLCSRLSFQIEKHILKSYNMIVLGNWYSLRFQIIKYSFLRTYDPPDPPNYFQQVVWPAYEEQYQKLSKSNLDIHFLDGRKPISENFSQLLQLILRHHI